MDQKKYKYYSSDLKSLKKNYDNVFFIFFNQHKYEHIMKNHVSNVQGLWQIETFFLSTFVEKITKKISEKFCVTKTPDKWKMKNEYKWNVSKLNG